MRSPTFSKSFYQRLTSEEFGNKLSGLWPMLCLIALAASCLLSGCQPQAQAGSEVSVDLKLNPSPPKTGEAEVVLTLTDAAENPIEGAQIKLEGNMNHAGMKPSFSDLKETTAGKYEGTLNFTMGGDWFVLVDGKLADGSRLDKKIDVPGVSAK